MTNVGVSRTNRKTDFKRVIFYDHQVKGQGHMKSCRKAHLCDIYQGSEGIFIGVKFITSYDKKINLLSIHDYGVKEKGHIKSS